MKQSDRENPVKPYFREILTENTKNGGFPTFVAS